jgi:DNA-binding transcriptional MocR family regulator
MVEPTITLSRGVPATESFQIEQLSSCFAEAIEGDAAVVLQYGQQQGYEPLRRALAAQYGVEPAEVMVGNGSLQILDLLAAHLIEPGQLVVTEQPSYDRAITTFRRRGARVIGVPLEHDGIDVDRLAALLERERPALIYLIPDFQNPAGVSLSLEKRRRVVELAGRYGVLVLEDVPYRRLRYRGEDIPLLRDIDPQRVVTMSSFSKLISPAVRVGYIVAPAALIAAVTRIGEDTYLTPTLPAQAAVATYLRRGLLEPGVAQLKALYTPRWQAMMRAVAQHLPDAVASAPDGGFFVSVTLPPGARVDNLVGRAKERGLILTPGPPFFADPCQGEAPDGERFVRLPFCAVTPDEIEEGVRRLASLL